ncbi:restriction endonuclease [Leisingera sp. HS039]|uniref:restriction endonuclease n=1 Tax=unclassified Leisingera TaxID=2614906 RepID=UPI00107126BC|nr:MULTISPECIES: restriction endonuclease [unclassified Leisingera]MBQ4826910.1 restriction endonuclease [Leisingera sp. HS039]QBR37110.1 restriction endonuclease [Leisingera sp. NJS201]
MGSINISRKSAVELFTEFAGFKAGIVVTENELAEILQDFNADLAAKITSEEVDGFRFHSTEVEEIAAHILYKLGNIDEPSTIPKHLRLFHKVKSDPKRLACYEYVMDCYNDFMRSIFSNPPPYGTALDPEPFMRAAMKGYGKDGLDMAMEVINGVNHQLHISPNGNIRSHDWKDVTELETLFKSESLDTMYGSFFDQRFIDYLERNFEKISEIHWRKFEGLAGEFFEREGFFVDVGPGRNDDGIDLRVYPKKETLDNPPLIIVQCKRQKEKIGKTLLKSVYADVLHEKSGSGLIVTSSYMSPGAETMRVARQYPVEAADRDTLRTWVTKMKSERV